MKIDLTLVERPILALVALLLSVSVGALAWGSWADFEATRDRARLAVTETAALAEERVGKEFSTALAFVERVAALVERSQDLTLSQPGTSLVLDGLEPGTRMLIADRHGGVTFYAGADQGVFDISDRLYFREHAQGKQIVFGPVLAARASGQPIVTVSRRLDTPDGSFLGVVAVALDPTDLVRIWRSLELGEDGAVMILRTDGRPVVSHPPLPPETLAGMDTSELMTAISHSRTATHEADCPLDGSRRIIAHTTFHSLPLLAVASMSTAEINRQWRKRQFRMLGAALPLLALLAGLGRWTLLAVRRERKSAARLAKALAEKEMLLAEVHHRVKNNLQIVQSLLTMEFLTAAPEAKNGYEESLQRIQAMGMVHELLYKSGEFGRIRCKEYIEHLSALLLGEPDRIALTVEGDEVEIDLDRAVPFAMAVNEILSNTLKHAFPGGRSGTVVVRLLHRGGRVGVSVTDDGIGMPMGFDPRISGNMGTRLLLGLAGQLNGEVTFESVAGTVVRLDFPFEGGDEP